MDDNTRTWLRDLFGDPPRDDTRGPGLDRETILRQNDMAGKVVHVTIPGQLVEDADGNPIGMTPNLTESSYFGVCMTLRNLAEAGLTPDDVPNIRIVDEPRKGQQ
ncbi:hypothetical protein [Rhodococcus yananensis]|uniref:hypothetical protein n=1 Tax=Rhodococcus yananensis TaxID=2879464 RepID=UPI001CF83B56|nr:hypothetical protein [Rhodococcus yananensis]